MLYIWPMTVLTPENLAANGYTLHARLEHNDLVSFVRGYVFRKNPVMIFYWSCNVVLILGALFGMFLTEYPLGLVTARFFLGFAAFFPLVPIHEAIHGLVYKLVDPSVQYKAVWRKLVFYAMADRFVTRSRPFFLLALAPFVLINGILLVLAFLLPGAWNWLVIGLLVMHTSGCSGDFALMSYFWEHRKDDPVTYDEVDNGVTWFYIRKSSAS